MDTGPGQYWAKMRKSIQITISDNHGQPRAIQDVNSTYFPFFTISLKPGHLGGKNYSPSVWKTVNLENRHGKGLKSAFYLTHISHSLQEHRFSLSFSVWLSVCLSLCRSVCLSVFLWVCLSVCLSICLTVGLSICQSVGLSFVLFVGLSVRPTHD